MRHTSLEREGKSREFSVFDFADRPTESDQLACFPDGRDVVRFSDSRLYRDLLVRDEDKIARGTPLGHGDFYRLVHAMRTFRKTRTATGYWFVTNSVARRKRGIGSDVFIGEGLEDAANVFFFIKKIIYYYCLRK